ncbi:MAG: hypothetical protein WAZ98_13785 [Cyclobacteriaceae bacterium]
MILKIFKAVWFLSMLSVLANLLYVYASLPEQVALSEDGVENLVVGRELFFYIAMVLISLSNVVVYLFSKKLTPQEDFRTWLHGLVITLNIFFIIGLSFISLYNSSENYDYSRIGFIIYSSVVLVVVWVVSWPVYALGKKLTAK